MILHYDSNFLSHESYTYRNRALNRWIFKRWVLGIRVIYYITLLSKCLKNKFNLLSFCLSNLCGIKLYPLRHPYILDLCTLWIKFYLLVYVYSLYVIYLFDVYTLVSRWEIFEVTFGLLFWFEESK